MYREYDYDAPEYTPAPMGEAYAAAPVYAEPALTSYDAQPLSSSDSGEYEDGDLITLVSPWLIQRMSATPMMLDGRPAVEVAMTMIRDYDRAAEACPYEGYDLLGWHNEVRIALRANRHGRWVGFLPSVGAFQPLGVGDGASINLGYGEINAVWRFIPEMLGQFDLWAYIYVNGTFVPFDDMMASEHYVDANGAAKMSVLL